MTKAQWDKQQAKFPPEDRISYDEYLASQGAASPVTSRLDAAAAANTANAASTIKQLQDLGVGGAPTVDARAALAKLTGGQTLTDDEKRVLGLPVSTTPTPTPTPTGDVTSNPLKNKSVKPTDAPAGYHYTWIGGTTTGSWVLYKDAPGAAPAGGGGAAGGAGGGPTQVYTASDGKTFTDQAAYASYENSLRNANLTTAYQAAADKNARQSAYDLLYNEFNKYGLGSLVENIKGLIQQNVSPSEFSIALQNTDAYKQRFAANQDRIKQGLRALTPAEYIGLEDQYQNIMRNYGLPASYWSKDSMGTQAGFNKFIANDVSAAELEDRIATAQKRVLNSDVNTLNALKQFYPDINTSDLLAYTLDPTNALENIKRKVTAAEIGGAALGQNLMTSAASAEDLARYGVTKAQAQQGYQTIGEFLPTATKLADIYQQQGLGPYTQGTAEQEIFGTQGAAAAAQKRKKLTQLEQATFGGQSGTAQGALARDRAGAY